MSRIEMNVPVARTEGLLIERVGDEAVVYDTGSKQAHCLTPLAAVVFDHCDGTCSIDELTALAAKRLEEPVERARVRDALALLEQRDLMDTRGAGLSRRDLMRKTVLAGAAATVTVPLITTIIAPTADAAASQFCNVLCKCCTSNTQCSGRSCKCTGKTAGAQKHCKPANAGADVCQGTIC